MAGFRSAAADRSGNAIVEFAFVAPVFLTMIIALIEVANYHWTRNTIDHAARETARMAITRGPWGGNWPGDEATLETTMKSYAKDRVTAANLRPASTTTTASVDVANRTINITVQYAYKPMIVPSSKITSGTMTATASMDLQRP